MSDLAQSAAARLLLDSPMSLNEITTIVDEAIEAGRKQAQDSEDELRVMLALSYAGTHLYTDDGELQDSSVFPHIDFKRDSVSAIKDKMAERARRWAQEHQAEIAAALATLKPKTEEEKWQDEAEAQMPG